MTSILQNFTYICLFNSFVLHTGDIALITKPVTLLEGERVILTTDILTAADSGGRPDELIYTVAVPPEHGHLHMVQTPGVPVFSFSQMDVAANRVCYTHDNSRFADRDSFRSVLFIVLFQFYIYIVRPDSILAPVCVYSREPNITCFDVNTLVKVHYVSVYKKTFKRVVYPRNEKNWQGSCQS